MIRLTCTSCQEVLEIDDAFAGGVCRCQHCGTIQTVPAYLKGDQGTGTGVSAQAAAEALKGPKTLYQHKTRAESGSTTGGSGTGLDDLAGIVTSSGLGAGRLTVPNKNLLKAKAASKRKFIAMAAGAGVVLLAVVIWFLVRPGGSTGPDGSGPGGVSASKANFCGVPLKGNSVVYVIDRGSATQKWFGRVMQATYGSIQSLGPDKKFQVMFWANEEPDVTYPTDGPAFATKEALQACKTAVDEVVVAGASEMEPTLKRALESKPDEIVIVTAKGWQLDDKFADSVKQLIGGQSVKVHTVSLGEVNEMNGLKRVASETGGTFKEIHADGELRDYFETN